jgi:oxidase EvaA
VTQPTMATHPVLQRPDSTVPRRFSESASVRHGSFLSLERFHQWWRERAAAGAFDVTCVPFTELRGWYFEPSTGNLVHSTGKFFSVEGLQVRTDSYVERSWTQPIINQPEIGILGILVKEFDGVLHCLMQAKMEPGNINTLQLSPTVQATRSNYTGVHRGGAVPYLEYFIDPPRERVRADVMQSEQAEWFLRKRNRNIVIEVTEDVPLYEDFCWLTIGQLHELLRIDNLVNMDARTVLSSIPFGAPSMPRVAGDFAEGLARSARLHGPVANTIPQIVSWFNDAKVRYRIHSRRIALLDLAGWRRTDQEIVHEDGEHFRVVAVSVKASNREIAEWTQPLIAPHGVGLSAFLVRRIHHVAHVLVSVDVSAGYVDSVELGPTVQCSTADWWDTPRELWPRYLDLVLDAPSEAVRYDTVHSEEGGRFYHALNRYAIVELGDSFEIEVPRDYMWVTLGQLTELVQRSFHLNVQARTLLAALHSLW